MADELELLFRDSGKVIWIVKKHNDMILAIIKSLLSSPTFQPRTGVLETLWLTIMHWNKIKIPSVRYLLKIEDQDGLDQREHDDNLTEKDRIFRDSIKMQITARMKRTNEGSDLKAQFDLGGTYEQYGLGAQNLHEARQVTKYTTAHGKGFDIDLTSSGLSQQLKDENYDDTLNKTA